MLIQTKEGDWWAVFLACRPINNQFENLGRETFMMPAVALISAHFKVRYPGVSVNEYSSDAEVLKVIHRISSTEESKFSINSKLP